MELENYYYACLQDKQGNITKKKFKDRQQARKYIADNYDPLVHTQAWTE